MVPQGALGDRAIVGGTARLADGSALPAWLKFDLRRGRLYGDAPRGLAGEIVVQLKLRYAGGGIRQVTLKFAPAGGRPAGKPGFEASLKASRLMLFAEN